MNQLLADVGEAPLAEQGYRPVRRVSSSHDYVCPTRERIRVI